MNDNVATPSSSPVATPSRSTGPGMSRHTEPAAGMHGETRLPAENPKYTGSPSATPLTVRDTSMLAMTASGPDSTRFGTAI